MRKKTSKPQTKKEVSTAKHKDEEEETEFLSELAEMAEDFGTDIDTIGQHFEKFTRCGILQPEEPEADLFSPEFKKAVLQKIDEVYGEDVEVISDDTVDADEIRLMEAVGYITFEKLVENGLLDLTEEENLEHEFEKIMKSMLFLLYVSGDFDAMLEQLAARNKGKIKKTTKKRKVKQSQKSKKKK